MLSLLLSLIMHKDLLQYLWFNITDGFLQLGKITMIGRGIPG